MLRPAIAVYDTCPACVHAVEDHAEGCSMCQCRVVAIGGGLLLQGRGITLTREQVDRMVGCIKVA